MEFFRNVIRSRSFLSQRIGETNRAAIRALCGCELTGRLIDFARTIQNREFVGRFSSGGGKGLLRSLAKHDVRWLYAEVIVVMLNRIIRDGFEFRDVRKHLLLEQDFMRDADSEIHGSGMVS